MRKNVRFPLLTTLQRKTWKPVLFQGCPRWGRNVGSVKIIGDLGRRCIVETRAIEFDGGNGYRQIDGTPGYQVFRVGKKAAGRLLDDREWSEFPQVQEITGGQPLKDLKTVAEEWEAFSDRIFEGMNPPPSHVQKMEMRKAFFGGFSALFFQIAGMGTPTDEELENHFGALKIELGLFAAFQRQLGSTFPFEG